MPLSFLFGLIGLLVGGVRGLLWGVVLGWAAGQLLRYFIAKGINSVRDQFLDVTFSVMGAVCKADGVVTRDEIRAAEDMFRRLHLSPEQREAAMAAFRRGKSPTFDLDGEVTRFARASRYRRPLMLMFLQMQVTAVAADGNVHAAEHQMLVRIARLLGLTEADVAQLESLLRAASAGPSAGPARSKLDDAYAALGLTPQATDAQVKQAYRRLMSQNHPDKLAAKGLPESMREMAEERTREISTAYALIKEARGFT
jgi:DnaJ like chaperone protein